MERFIRMMVMGMLPFLLAAACCCSSSPLIQLIGNNLATQESNGLNIPPEQIELTPVTTTVVPSGFPEVEFTIEPTRTALVLEIPTATSGPTSTVVLPAEQIADDMITYDIIHTIYLTTEGRGKATDINMNVALIRTISPYQELVSRNISPSQYTVLSDVYQNEYAYFLIDQVNHGETFSIVITYEVNVYEISTTLGVCQGNLIDTQLASEKYIESDNEVVVNLAEDLSEGKTTVCDQERAFYDYLVDNMEYGGYNAGEVGAAEALQTMEGDCTEYTDSMVALSRSVGIPARFLEGIVCCTNNGYSDSKNKHNWLDVYLPVVEWTPMDPTWGQQPRGRDKYFGGVTADHIIVTVGRNLDRLGGYHYFYYTYFREAAETELTWSESWSILKRE